MGDIIRFNIGENASIEADTDNILFTKGEMIKPGTDKNALTLNISENIMDYSFMGYTTDVDTLKLIFDNMTLRCSSLNNAYLNDPMEKERVDVSEYASIKFIVCFCHLDHECVPFWIYYGKKDRKKKVLMRFNNFSSRFEECIYTDYAFTKDRKKCYFTHNQFGKDINAHTIEGKPLNPEFDYSSYIDSVLMFDIDYIPLESDEFTKSNSGDIWVKVNSSNGKNNSVKMKAKDPTVLGKQKSNPWEYEKETRILCSLHDLTISEWGFIDLRVKPEIFRNLCIILSPWDDGDLKNHIQSIIEKSSLPRDVKDSITIKESGLKGKLNFPE